MDKVTIESNPEIVSRTGCVLLLVLGVLSAGNAFSARHSGPAGDGITDDTQALQKAIDELPRSGGILTLPPGRYRIRNTLEIGDGSISRSSSNHNLAVVGAGIGSTADKGFPDDGSTEIIWDGDPGGTMVRINGPISAVLLEGIRFSARRSAGTCLDIRHAYNSTFRRLQCSDFTAVGFVLTSYSSVPAVAAGANSNRWEQIFAWSPLPDVTGLILGSPERTGPGILSVSGNRFDTVEIHVNGENATGIELRFADYHSFTQVGVLAERGNGLKVTTVPGARGFPGAIWFYQSSFVARNPTAGGYDWYGDQKIFFWPWHTGDGERIPTEPWAAGISSAGKLFGFSMW
jgi:hypothetical protein